MSGIYIPGVEMPKNCDCCDFMTVEGEYGEPTCPFGRIIRCASERHPDCPLVPVPELGDLFDRDSTIEKIRHLSDEIDKKLGYEKSAPYIAMALYLSNADDFPTIIPADEEAEK